MQSNWKFLSWGNVSNVNNLEPYGDPIMDYLGVTVTITNNLSKPVPYNALDFKLTDNHNGVFEIDAGTYGLKQPLEDGQVTITGQLMFAVPKSNHSTNTTYWLKYSDNPYDDNSWVTVPFRK